MNYAENLKLTQWRNLFTIFKSSSVQSFNIFGVQEGFVFEFISLSGVWKFGNLFYWAGPTSQQPTLVSNCACWWTRPRARHRPGHHVVTVRQHWSLPIATAAHAGAALSSANGCSLPFTLLLPHCFGLSPQLCLACACHPTRRRPPPCPTLSPSEPRNLTAIFHWRCSSTFELEPPATAPSRTPPPIASSSASGLPSTTVVWPAPCRPTAPWAYSLFSGAYRPQVLLRQPLVQDIIDNCQSPPTALPLISRAGEPLSSQPPPICPPQSKLPPRQLFAPPHRRKWPESASELSAGERGEEPYFQIGPARNNAFFFFLIDLFNSNFQFEFKLI
jgi:hypothetical protein